MEHKEQKSEHRRREQGDGGYLLCGEVFALPRDHHTAEQDIQSRVMHGLDYGKLAAEHGRAVFEVDGDEQHDEQGDEQGAHRLYAFYASGHHRSRGDRGDRAEEGNARRSAKDIFAARDHGCRRRE